MATLSEIILAERQSYFMLLLDYAILATQVRKTRRTPEDLRSLADLHSEVGAWMQGAGKAE